MAISVDVAKDPKAIKPKFIGFLTKRQVVCFSIAALCGIPFYLLVKSSVGTDIAVLLMIAVMLPFFFVAMYEKEGMPAEKYMMQVITMKFLRPGIRRYKAESLYEQLMIKQEIEKEGEALERKQRKAKEKKKE